MQLVNNVCQSGFLIGLERALLGNCLSSYANLFVLSERTGLPFRYDYISNYFDLFEKPVGLTIHDPNALLDLGRLETLCEKVNLWIGDRSLREFAKAGTEINELGSAGVMNVVWLANFEESISDWSANNAEKNILDFCRRGNGVLLAGAYWRQYTDMSKLQRFGDTLREKLGKLNVDGHVQRRDLMDECRSILRIGIHMRVSEDYKTWHGGAFHFSIDDYTSIIQRIENEIRDQKYEIFLFSDSNIVEDLDTKDKPKFFRSSEIHDMIALGKCDFVVGPPSTFGTWSAFLGKSKRIILTRKVLEDTSISLISTAKSIIFPTGAYLPGDECAGPI